MAGTAAFAAAGGGDDDTTQAPITGSALEGDCPALEHTGGGRVTGTEVGDEEGSTLINGSQVDVHLDEAFNIHARRHE